MRHLTSAFAQGALRRGRQIEQLLGGFDHGEDHVIRWAALSPGRAGITLYLSEVIDIGSATFCDVSEFPPFDPDEETWGKVIGTVTDPVDALDLAERELGAVRDLWVNHGVIGDEYIDYRTRRRSSRSP
ncbi:hypothetical protein ACSNOI_31505 [Actinomadura kijaniata]|uniref:hypothetical protein n=1 Tax=Actinomadura kijaniata TaxID=46161 RepID=UPI003F1E1FEA